MSKKRLFYDIETSPNIGFFWRSGYKLQVPPDNIIKEREIICISYKWEGDDKVKTLHWGQKQCDKTLLKKFIKIMSQATEIVAHNGDRFDVKWIKGRCLYHRLEIPESFVTIDTCKQARKHFGLNSNKLDYLGKYLGVGEKHETGGFDLWKSIILDKDKEALQKMIDYCEQDVLLLERVYNEMKNYIDIRFNYSTYEGGEKYACPECGNTHVICNQTITTKMGTIKRRMLCKNQECKRSFTISNKSYMTLLIDRLHNKI